MNGKPIMPTGESYAPSKSTRMKQYVTIITKLSAALIMKLVIIALGTTVDAFFVSSAWSGVSRCGVQTVEIRLTMCAVASDPDL